MADKGKHNFEKKALSAPKRSYKEIEHSDEGNLAHSSSSNDCSNSSFSSKRLRVYRDQNNESLDTDSFKNTLDSPSFSNSVDSVTWHLSHSKTASLGSLELNSIIQKYDNTTLNSLSMSQSMMSSFCENAISSPFHQPDEMVSPSGSKIPSLNSLSMNQAIRSLSGNDTSPQSMELASLSSQYSFSSKKESFSADTFSSPESVDMASLSSQSSFLNTEETLGTQAQEKSTQFSFNSSVYIASETKGKDNSSSVHNTCNISNTLSVTVDSAKSSIKSEKNKANLSDENNEKFVKPEQKGSGQESVQNDMHRNDNEKLQSTDKENITTITISADKKHLEKCDEDSDSETTVRHETNSELKENFGSCKKNPGHHKFYSPQKLKVKNLPQEIQHEDSVTFFQCLSRLVVQISVSSTSDRRSDNDIYSSYIGTDKVRNGSGFIASTDDNILKIRCAQKNCSFNEESETSSRFDEPVFDRSLSNMSTASTSSSSSRESISGGNQRKKKHFIYGGVYIRTNKHVIFDKSEADNACVKFFYDSSDQKDVVKGHVSSIHGVNNDQDHIILHVMSHNKLVLDTIGLHLKNAKSSYAQMIKSTHNTQQNHGCKFGWVAVISHPHGTPNSISFGRLRKEEAETKRVIKYYDAATCPGSSGGLVVTPTLLHLQWPGAVHSSFCQKTKHNVSLDSRFQELESSVIGEMNKNILNRKESAPESQYSI